MSYTLLQVSDFDPAELARIDLAGIDDHDAAVRRIQHHSMGWSWASEQTFRALGVSCRTLIPASEAVRRLAPLSSEGEARDEGEPEHDPGGGLAYVVRAIQRIRPAVVCLDNPAFLDPWSIDQLRDRPDPPLLITHFCADLRPEAEANLHRYDLVLCCSPHFQALAQARGARTLLHYHAAPPAALDLPLPPLEHRLRRACFIGSIVAGSRYHARRVQVLRQICQARVPIDLYSEAPRSRLVAGLRRRGGNTPLARVLAGVEHRLAAGSPLRQALRPPVYGPAMFDTLRRYICAVNVHAGMAQGYAANMRLFEAAALGVCLISEDHPNLGDLFEPEREILTYGNVQDLIERIRFCVDHPEEAHAIGTRARHRAMVRHRYGHRIQALHDHLLQRLHDPR